MRASGILMPVFSLPGPFGIGTLGSEATAFVDFLAEAKQTYWQILPIGPTGYGDSPYQSFSAFAGNPYFIDFRLLAADGYLTAEEIPAAQPVSTVDYGALYNQRPVLLKKAADRLLAAPSPAYEAFCTAQSFWLEDYALFMAVKAEQGQAGLADWPDALRCREPEVIAAAKAANADHFIRTLPGGYQMELNEDASNVSQGQKQLLTIARTILADNRILILDEATSSVDTRTEQRIQTAMDRLMEGRTSFVIAHRLSTIKDADLILVMRDGDIVEQGTHDQLIEAGGFYADLYNSQFEDVVD